jgi:integrase
MLLNNLLSWANQYGYIADQIHIKPGKIKDKKRDPELEYLEKEELAEVLNQMDGTMDYYICKFLALTGCRIGEAAALTLSDLDDKYIHITKAYKLENGVSTPKTEHSNREIYIQPELRSFLKEYETWRKIRMMEIGVRTDLLFFTRNGSYISNNTLLLKLKKLSCNKHLHPHIFRHTHVALLAEQGMSLEAIARRLGHSDSKITKEVYFHVTEKLKERDEKALDKISIL